MARYELLEEKDAPSEGRFELIEEKASQDTIPQMGRGGAQGFLDLLSLPGLIKYPIERGVQKALGVEDEPGRNLPGQDVRYKQQSDILEKINSGHKPSFSELMMLSDDDDLMPMGSGSTELSNIQSMQEEIPEGGLIQEGTRRVTRSLPWAIGGAGPLKEALTSEFLGLGAKEAVKSMGGGDTAQMWADIIGGLGGALKRTPSSGKTNVPLVAESPGGLKAGIEKLSPNAVEKRVLSLGDDIIRQAEERISNVSQETMRDFGKFTARETEDLITDANRKNILNTISPQDQLPKQAWEDIQKATHNLYEAERDTFRPIYETVREGAKKIKIQPASARNIAKSQLAKITNVETNPAGYSQIENIMRQVERDLGVSVSDGKQIVKPISADKLMDLSIRLNDAINYEALSPSVKDLLKPLQKAVKEDFKQAIDKSGNLGKKFNQAEELYKKTADRFGKDVINRLRSTENAEYLGNEFLNPSNFENLKKVFAGKGNELSKAERQLVDLIGKQGQKQAQETIRQLEPYLSNQAKKASTDFMNLGDNLTNQGQRRTLQRNMLNDVAESIGTGSRPNLTLTAMRTPEGYHAARNTFGRTQQGKRLFKVLEKQTVEDMFSSITKDGKIDWNKAKQILDDPGYRKVMENIMGIDGVQFVRNIEKWSNNIVQNMAGKKFAQPSTWTNFINTLDTPVKSILTLLLGSQFGILSGVGLVSAGNYLIKGIAKALTSPSLRQTIRELADPSVTGKALMKSANILNAELQE